MTDTSFNPPQIFFEVHSQMPQEGPGLSSATRRAFEMLTDLPPRPCILDLACGPGRQTYDLSQLSDGMLVATDMHWPFLLDTAQKVDPKVNISRSDIRKPCFQPNSFDLIWSEGAIYIAGFEQGLKKWRPYLKQGGYIAVTEISWLKPTTELPSALRNFWQEAYPEMATVDENIARLTRAGYELVGQFALPEAAWWAYYEPLRGRIAAMREKYAGNTAVLALLEEEEQEIKLYEQYAEYYSYVFYIGRVALRPDA